MTDAPEPLEAEVDADAAASKDREIPPVPFFTATQRPDSPPPFMVVDDEFVAQTTEGEFKTSLRVPEKIWLAMADLLQRDQFALMLEARDQKDWAERIGDLDVTDAKILRSKFFQAHYEREQARLGESFGSSDS